MCGICGVCYADPSANVDASLLTSMRDAITHRGPDDEGYFVQGQVSLGMRRLSIIDVEGGKQPIHNEHSTIHIVYNGEIYNYIELKRELEGLGHRFYTRSDTEVIVHAYEAYGTSCLSKLRGMFALALWDARRQELVLAVDRFGIKPLFYTVNQQYIAFGSELKCLLAAGLVQRELDVEALAEYFRIGAVAAPATIFRGARKLPPGTFLRWNRHTAATVRQYWDVPVDRIDRSRPLAETRRQLRAVLRDAVRSHLVSDVPIGAFLSGGLDSSVVVALMSSVSAEPVKTFSIGFKDKAYNELDMARLVAQRFRTNHHEMVIEPECVDVLPRLVAQFDEPFADASALPTYYVSKLARSQVKVALSGDGGDELFLGYPIFQGLELARHAQRLPASVRRGLTTLASALPRTSEPGLNDRLATWRKRIVDSALPPDEAFRSKITTAAWSTVRSLLSRDLRTRLDQQDAFRRVDEYLARCPASNGAHPLHRFAYTGLKIGLANRILVKVDRMSMMSSLEVRVPLLDHLLAEYVATIPIEQHLSHWRLKGLLRDTMACDLPPEILRHPKHGFNVPLSAWFRGDLSSFASDVLLSDRVRQAGYFDIDAVGRMLKLHRQGAHNLSDAIWSLLVFELWRQEVC